MKKINLFKVLLITFFISITTNAFAYTTIAIDGVKYTNYAILSNTKTGNNVYKDFNKAVNSGKTTIIVDEGTFYSNGTATLTKNNVTITGISKDKSIIIETDPTKDLLRIYANNVLVKNLTLDTKTNNAQAAFVVGDGNENETTDETKAGNNVTLSGSNILGGNNIFTLYYAGPTYRKTIYDKYIKNDLNDGNKVINNYIEGSYKGDSFVFGLQKNGLVQGNTFNGGQLSIYMDVSTTIENNIVQNSNLTGIFMSGPCKSLTLQNNNISNSVEHGIKGFYSLEIIPIPDNLKYILTSNLSGNKISNSGETGIDVSYFNGGTIQNNTITNSAVHGIALLTNSSNNVVKNNIIDLFGQALRFRGSGLYIAVNANNNTIDSNTITTNKLQLEYGGIVIDTPEITGTIIKNNTVSGSFQFAGLYSYTDQLNLSNNTFTNYYGPAILYTNLK